MSALTETEISALLERGFKYNAIRNTQHAAHWRQVSQQPISFFYSATKDTFMRELDRKNIPYRVNQPKYELQQLLLDAELDYFRIICRASIGGVPDGVFTVHKDVTMKQILQDYSNAVNTDAVGRQLNFISVRCAGRNVGPNTKMSALANTWSQRPLSPSVRAQANTSRNIVEIDVY